MSESVYPNVPPPAEVPPALPAATVILLRDVPGGFEALLLKRNDRGAFGGMWVFPGGRVDDEDADPSAPGDEVAAARRCAAREALEEAALLLDPSEFSVWSHWTPPAVTPKRFSTWFFVASTDHAAEVTVDGAEIHEHAWMTPVDALARHAAAEIEMAPPTWVTLLQLSAYGSADEAIAASRAPEYLVDHFVTQMTPPPDGPLLRWHGDVSYGDDGALHADGPRHRLLMMQRPWTYVRTPS